MKFLSAVILAAALTSACAQPRHVAVLADTALYEVISDTHSIEQTVLCGMPSCAGVSSRPTAGWDDAKSRLFNAHLLPAVAAGREFNSILASWKPGQPMPAMLHNLILSLSQSLSAIASDFPEGQTKTNILADISKAQSIVLSAMDLLMSVGLN